MPKITTVPEHLKMLLPEHTKATVIVGNDAYEIIPLTAAQLETLSQEIVEISGLFVKDVLAATERINVKGEATKVEAEQFYAALRSTVERMFKEGRLNAMLSTLLDEDPEKVRRNITVPQIHHLLSVFYKQNIDFESPGESSKNFCGLLETFGVYNTNVKVVLRWADYSLHVLSNAAIGSWESRAKVILLAAKDLNLVSEQEMVSLFPNGSNSGTPALPASTVSPASTSVGNDTPSADSSTAPASGASVEPAKT